MLDRCAANRTTGKRQKNGTVLVQNLQFDAVRDISISSCYLLALSRLLSVRDLIGVPLECALMACSVTASLFLMSKYCHTRR